MSAAVIAYGAVSALGAGSEAASAGEIGDAPRIGIARDEELVRAGLARPFAARASVSPAGGDEVGDRATRLLSMSLGDCLRELDLREPGWRRKRIGLAIGTSSGGMRTAERFFARVEAGEALDAQLAARAAYFGPLLDAVGEAGLEVAPATLILCACASSAIAIGLAARWLAAGECDLALAGGFDAVSPFVAAGFEALHATSAAVPPRPFRAGRDGMALGEAAAVLALVRERDASSAPLGYVSGFGASADAVHITAPDRTGAGLARAARLALVEAGEPPVDLISAHATATPFNDAAEVRGIDEAVGAEGARSVAVHAFKAQVGHTLGAAGALESLVCLDAFRRGVLPATAGEGPLDPESAVRLLDRNAAGSPRVALKLASAFGGANAALVLRREPAPARRPAAARGAWITRAARVTVLPDVGALAETVGVPLEKLGRADAQVLWGIAAVAALRARLAVQAGESDARGGAAALAGAGVVVGTAAATLETNARFASRLRSRGARFVEPRRFPYTSPNAVAGECGVAFGLQGPAFAVGAGLHAGVEALAAAVALVRAGDAERMVVVAVDDVGDAARAWGDAVGAPLVAGGIALLVTGEKTPSSFARVEAARTSLAPAPRTEPGAGAAAGPVGHLALALLDAEVPPSHVESASALLGTLARARVDLAPI